LILFFLPYCCEAAMLEKGVGDHRHKRMTVKALPGLALEVIKTKVYFVKQLQIRDEDGGETDTRLVHMLREYTVFNVEQCENLPDSVTTGKPMRVRNSTQFLPTF
jgi:hypothetical protein